MTIGSEYDILEIHVRAPRPDGRRAVEMRLLGNQVDFPPGALLLDEPTLERFLHVAPEDYGRTLGEALFCDPVGASYAQCLAAASAQGRLLRVRLRLDEEDALHAVRWERMYQCMSGEWCPLALTASTPLSRWVYNNDLQPQLSAERPLRVLAVISSPKNIAAYGLDPIAAAERASLHEMFDAHRGNLEVTYLESGTVSPPTLSALNGALASGGFHILHFLCHGAMIDVAPEDPEDRPTRESVLYLEWSEEERQGHGAEARLVEARQLVRTIKPLAVPPVLVFLAACESAAHPGAEDVPFRTLGQQLVWPGRARAALAMSDQVGLATARQFTSTFYSRLHTHGVVDIAVNEARASVQQRWDWSVPVLYSRLRNNQILASPLDGGTGGILDCADSALKTAGEALHIARSLSGVVPVDIEHEVVAPLEALIEELRKTHEVLVRTASDFRETGSDPATFRQRFEAFYHPFKRYYDGRVWASEDTSCHRVGMIRDFVVPKLAGILDPRSLEQLRQELDILGSADATILAEMCGFLDAMDEAVEDVYALTFDPSPDAITRAIARKREFELQLSARFRRSRALLEQMNRSVLGAIRAA